MSDPFGDSPTNHWIPFADILSGILAIFLVVAVLLTFHLTDPKKQAADAQIKSPGTINVLAFWKEDVDVDLWVKSPGDARPVGYSRKQGKYLDLLRDDLGRGFERAMDRHYENVFARSSPAGEYIVNLHMYSDYFNAKFPIQVEVKVELVKQNVDKGDVKSVISTTLNLNELGQESTVVRFSLDQNGDLVPGSVNHEPLPLRVPR